MQSVTHCGIRQFSAIFNDRIYIFVNFINVFRKAPISYCICSTNRLILRTLFFCLIQLLMNFFDDRKIFKKSLFLRKKTILENAKIVWKAFEFHSTIKSRSAEFIYYERH